MPAIHRMSRAKRDALLRRYAGKRVRILYSMLRDAESATWIEARLAGVADPLTGGLTSFAILVPILGSGEAIERGMLSSISTATIIKIEEVTGRADD